MLPQLAFLQGLKPRAYCLVFPTVETAGYKDGEIQSGGKPPHSMRSETQLRGRCYS
jgi:hypothetical protein